MGALYEKKQARTRESRAAYRGALSVLRQFIARDKYTHDHFFRVAKYPTRIAKHMGFDPDRIDDVWDAALLHDIGKMKISREILHKAAPLTQSEL